MKLPSKPLFEGVRVLDLTRVMSGPFCTAMLADLGAEVIKIEMPGFGEEGRYVAPLVNGESSYFALLNRGKRSVTVNMKSPEGVSLIRDLCRQSDVLVENFRPGVMNRLGLGYSDLEPINSRLIYASISGFGEKGPFADWPAFDLVIQAMSGLMSVTGERGGRAIAVGESIADVTTGMFAAWGIAAALFDRERSGAGRKLDVAMLDSLFSMMVTHLSRHLFSDQVSERVGNRHPLSYPVDSFATLDGDIVLVGFSEPIVKRIFKGIGRPELIDDPRFQTNADRNTHEAELRSIIATWAAILSREEALRILRDADVPAAPVLTIEELLDTGHVEARNLLQPGINSNMGDIKLVPQPVRFSGVDPIPTMRSPTLGEHTELVLREKLKLDEDKIAAMRAAQTV